MPLKTDLVIPKKFIDMFGSKLRILDPGHTKGIWEFDISKFKGADARLVKAVKGTKLSKNHAFFLTYTGSGGDTNIQEALLRYGITKSPQIEKFIINGIPVPFKLRNFQVVLTQRQRQM